MIRALAHFLVLLLTLVLPVDVQAQSAAAVPTAEEAERMTNWPSAQRASKS
jgi:hypothetical protein